MKFKLLFAIVAAVFSFSPFTASTALAAGGGYGEHLEAGSDAVDVWDTANKATNSFADLMQAAMRKSTDDKFLDGAVKSLDAVGVDGGWAKQIGNLSDIAEATEKLGKVLDIAGKVLSYGASASNVYDAYKSGDQSKFRQVVADEITKQVASFVGGLVQSAITTNGQGLVVAAASGGPIAMILAEAGVLVAGYYAGKKVEEAVSWTVSEVGLRNVIEGLADKVWEALHDDDDAFNNPNPDPGDGGSGGMCPAPSRPIGLTPLQAY